MPLRAGMMCPCAPRRPSMGATGRGWKCCGWRGVATQFGDRGVPRAWWREVIALGRFAVQVVEALDLSMTFDAFGDHRKAEGVRGSDDEFEQL